ncbi:hypothetical protein GOP47_0006479 [Adiantum capillus-veneris]|uniref:Uncharacterized protein n=1 Tax=Adiantum capillus-veneris TaxID=13818 RepID=A0A9D4V362_ADICA|nr:hypothetical protein GOP47_0006479 [Adiantum capillus-veneris]
MLAAVNSTQSLWKPKSRKQVIMSIVSQICEPSVSSVFGREGVLSLFTAEYPSCFLRPMDFTSRPPHLVIEDIKSRFMMITLEELHLAMLEALMEECEVKRGIRGCKTWTDVVEPQYEIRGADGIVRAEELRLQSCNLVASNVGDGEGAYNMGKGV